MVGHGDRGLAHAQARSEEHTSELQSQSNLVCRLLLEKKKKKRRCLQVEAQRLLLLPSVAIKLHHLPKAVTEAILTVTVCAEDSRTNQYQTPRTYNQLL